MSSSASGNAPDSNDADSDPDGTNVTYHVEFEVATTGNLQGVVVTFCADSPIIEDTSCVFPTGFSLASATVSGQSDGTGGSADITAWTTVQLEDHSTGSAGNNTVTLSNGTNVAVTAGDIIYFDIEGITNPNLQTLTLGTENTFYSRVYTYDTQAEAQGYTLADPNAVGDAIEAGGIALSTAQQINITSKVQERLTFCVYTAASFTITTDNNCTSKPSLATPGAGNTINLGDTNGVLDSAGPYVDKTAYFGITTNAAGEAAVRMKGDTLRLTPACAAANCRIDAVGGTAAASTTGAEQFGLCAYQIDGTGLTIEAGPPDYTGGGAACAATTQTSGTGSFGGAGAATFAFDTNNTTGTTSTYGQQIASKPAGAFSTGNLVFIGNISDTTEPGIYTTTLTFVATGTY